MTIRLTILGSTGTIGVNTLDVVQRLSGQFSIFALTANSNVASLFEQCRVWQPRYAVMEEEQAADELNQRCRSAGLEVEVLSGKEALADVAAHDETDYVMPGLSARRDCCLILLQHVPVSA